MNDLLQTLREVSNESYNNPITTTIRLTADIKQLVNELTTTQTFNTI